MQTNIKKVIYCELDGTKDFIGSNFTEVMHHLCEMFKPIIVDGIDNPEYQSTQITLRNEYACQDKCFNGDAWLTIMEAVATAMQCYSKLGQELFYYPMSFSEMFTTMNEYLAKADISGEDRFTVIKMKNLLERIEWHLPIDNYDRSTHQWVESKE